MADTSREPTEDGNEHLQKRSRSELTKISSGLLVASMVREKRDRSRPSDVVDVNGVVTGRMPRLILPPALFRERSSLVRPRRSPIGSSDGGKGPTNGCTIARRRARNPVSSPDGAIGRNRYGHACIGRRYRVEPSVYQTSW